MGFCCSRDGKSLTEEVIIFNESDILREKIIKAFRLNPLHNFGSRRQNMLDKEFKEFYYSQSKTPSVYTILKFFSKPGPTNKIFNSVEKQWIEFILQILEKHLDIFIEPEIIFLNSLIFVLTNTKNNIDKKQEVILEIFNDVFFLNKNERIIDLEKLKKYIKSLVQISLTIFMNFILLNVFETKENISKLINPATNFTIEEKYDKNNIPEYIFYKIKKEINKSHTFLKLVQRWEEYLLGPIIFAGYSHEKNVSSYNLKIKDEIIPRIAHIYDSDKIIDSFVKLKIEEI
jgi:hypothetical protein